VTYRRLVVTEVEATKVPDTLRSVRLQVTNPAEHRALFSLPWQTPLAEWPIDGLVDPGGLHRHVVRFFEHEETTYVLKELPDPLAEREYRLLRELVDRDLPAATALGVCVGRTGDSAGEGVLITRHIDFALPYRILLSGRGLRIPYLGERLLDALVGLLVRLHIAGFYWGDCSLSNTLFRRDAGALVAFVIDVETGELHPSLSDGQRAADLTIATENVAGGLYDLQAGGYLADGIDPFDTAAEVERRYHLLWKELTAEETFRPDEVFRIDQRLRRLHDLGFDVREVEYIASEGNERVRLVPRVVELGYFAPQLAALTGLRAGENQARRLLDDIRQFGVSMECRTGKRLPENVVATRWLDQVFEPSMAAVPAELADRLEPAELFHQLLEHRWFLCERAGKDVGLSLALQSYVDDVLRDAPDEHIVLDPSTMELPIVSSDPRVLPDRYPTTR
jgi:Domain of unknown function (DUF4032)/Lipopolysaccharide kinase (Kdo/WaaP) family